MLIMVGLKGGSRLGPTYILFAGSCCDFFIREPKHPMTVFIFARLHLIQGNLNSLAAAISAITMIDAVGFPTGIPGNTPESMTNRLSGREPVNPCISIVGNDSIYRCPTLLDLHQLQILKSLHPHV